MEMFCYGKIVRPHHEDNGFLEEKVKLLLLDERRALIRKFAIKRDDDRMKGINKVHWLHDGIPMKKYWLWKSTKICECCPFHFLLVYDSFWFQWTEKYNDNLFQAIEFYNGLPSQYETKISHFCEEKNPWNFLLNLWKYAGDWSWDFISPLPRHVMYKRCNPQKISFCFTNSGKVFQLLWLSFSKNILSSRYIICFMFW